MSHPLRVRLLAMLAERAASPVELAGRVDASLGTVAYHVRTLCDLGLIELVEERRVRGAVEHVYKATHRPRVSDDAWSKAPASAKQAAIGSTLQVIDEYARASAAAGGFDRADAHLTRTAVRLDAKGWRDLAKACERLMEEADRIGRECEKRAAADGDHIDAAVVLMLFETVALSGGS